MNINSSTNSSTSDRTKLKLVFLGEQSVGKSSIIEKYMHGRFQESLNPTIGIDFLAKNIKYKTKSYRLQLWDTAGQERYRSLIPNYLKDADVALIVFDVALRDSFDHVYSWITLFNQNKNKEGIIYLVGNKIDLKTRTVGKAEAKSKADALGMLYFEISAKTGQNVEELFKKIIQQASNKTQKIQIENYQQKERIAIEDRIKQQNSSKKLSLQNTLKITAQKEQQETIANNNILKTIKIQVKSHRNRKDCC